MLFWSDHDAVFLVVHKEKDGIIQEKQHIPKTTSDIPAKRKQRSEKTDSPSKKLNLIKILMRWIVKCKKK